MSNAHFKILREGVNTTIQDSGRKHLYDIGITVSGAMDQRNFILANRIVNNDLEEAVIEFAYQGPLLELKNGKINFVITGDVFFNIIRKNSEIEVGKCYQNYILDDKEQIDIVSTKKSIYGYLSIEGGFKLKQVWKSYSINTKAKIGPNNGKKFSTNEKIFFKEELIKKTVDRKIDYKDTFDGIVRVIKGTNFNYLNA